MTFPEETAGNASQNHAIMEEEHKPFNVFSLSDNKLSVGRFTLLSDVPDNVRFNSYNSTCRESDAPDDIVRHVSSRSCNGGFLGIEKDKPFEMMWNSLGKFSNRRFLSIFRFKYWWSTMWVGNCGSDLQVETQWVLLDVPELSSYVLILPLIEGNFRSALHPGGDNGHVMICAESGSSHVKTTFFSAIVYLHLCDNPYTLMKEAYSAARVHLNTFRLLEEKPVPSLADKFGWCTWDAFYSWVEPVGVWHGVKHFYDGGLQLRFLIIDDGWQSTLKDGRDPDEDLVLGEIQMIPRLYRFEENDKFKKYKSGTFLGPSAPSFDPVKQKGLIRKKLEVVQAEEFLDKAVKSRSSDTSEFQTKVEKLRKELDQITRGSLQAERVEERKDDTCEEVVVGLKGFVKDLRTQFRGLDDIYVWQALCGAWGGVVPGDTHLNSKIIPAVISPALRGMMTDLSLVKIVENGVGLVHPDMAADFYESMHSFLANAGITGVKVDVIQILEYVCQEFGGRVQLGKIYYDGLTKSLVKNFNGMGLISSMQQCNDFFFLGTRQISLGRVGDDFWFEDPNGDPTGVYWLQGVHMIHCAYNSMWMGQMIQPDWDMFQSDHLCAEFHAASRAICGGPIYVSDSVGGHDFDLLRKLVFPDGTLPKCQHFALPTRDCLFKNPLFDGDSVLKIWNLNKYGGVVGAFNCKGAGWDTKERRIRGYPHHYRQASGSIHVTDIEWNQKKETSTMGSAEEYALYLSQAQKLLLVTSKSKAIDITIQPSGFEIFSYFPIKKISSTINFAPVGLTNMFNCGGTILGFEHMDFSFTIKIKVKGGGTFLMYSSETPRKIFLNGMERKFRYLDSGSLAVDLPWKEETSGVSELEVLY